MDQWHHFKTSKRSSRSSVHVTFIIFWLSSVLFALFLFLFAFFPMKAVSEDFATKEYMPTKLSNISLDTDILYRKRTGRFVFVLIDAFRWDFLETPAYMPYVSNLRRSNQATILTARCHPPTATMPRIKALMTGSIPNYVDVILNLGSDQVKEDNLIHQAVKNGLKIVFYGDEVWLDLFPDKFTRKEGTTSFFVSDYTEVDVNVTRNIAKEMKRSDWDILILHYLGLDHIGHLAGPNSPLVPNKLKEMDAVIENLHKSLQQWDVEHPEEPSYLVVVGDHGMHDSGSHGGATLGEILVSLVLIENVARNISLSVRPEVSQIDIAATLAVLLGLPIPRTSLGVLIPYALTRLTHEQYLFALLYNAQQVADQFLLAHPNGRLEDSFTTFLQAQIAHLSWHKSKTDGLRQRAESLYFSATQEMSSYIVKNLVAFDVWLLAMGCLILVLVLLCLLIANAELNNENFWKKGKRIILFFVTGFAALCPFLSLSAFCRTIFSSSEKYICIVLFAVFTVLTLCWNFLVLLNSYQGLKLKSVSTTSTFLCIGSVLHSISLSASSLIEEEHQTWYFMWITLVLLTLISVWSKTSYGLKFMLMTVLLSHRFLRKLNQTGDKWASIPDIADWLELPENQIVLFLLFVIVWVRFFLRMHLPAQAHYSFVPTMLFSFLTWCSQVLPFEEFSSNHSLALSAMYGWATLCFFTSLSTIAIATGYIGTEHQNMLTAGLLVFLHTYCFPVLATFLMWLMTANQTDGLGRRAIMMSNLRLAFLSRLLPLSVYCIVIFCQRNHLFIWSVFAPKLLYEAVHSTVSLLLVILGCTFLLSCDITDGINTFL